MTADTPHVWVQGQVVLTYRDGTQRQFPVDSLARYSSFVVTIALCWCSELTPTHVCEMHPEPRSFGDLGRTREEAGAVYGLE